MIVAPAPRSPKPPICPRGAKSNRRRRLAFIPIALFALAALLIDGGIRRPCAPAEGASLNGVATLSPAAETLRIGLMNINSGRGDDDRLDLDRTARALRGLDVIALNEVRGRSPLIAADRAELLGQRLVLPWLFAPYERRWWRDDFGNGLLAAPPVARWRAEPLPHSNVKGHGNLLEAEIDFAGGTLNLLVTHVDRRRDRLPQLLRVLERFRQLPEPVVLLGDLNSTADEPLLAELLAEPGVADPLRLPQAWGDRPRFDWIVTRGLRILDAGAIDDGASDHPVFWVEVMRP